MKRFARGLLTLALLAPLPAFATGAIAVDDRGGYGYSVRQPGRNAAERAALYRCREATRSNCRVVLWFERCGAYASNRNTAGSGYGPGERVAIRGAMEACGERGCHIVVSACE
jgi:hypothetical protein